MLRGSPIRACRLLLRHPFARCPTPTSSLLLKSWSATIGGTAPPAPSSSFPHTNGPCPLAPRRFCSAGTIGVGPIEPVQELLGVFEEFLSSLTVPPEKRSSLLEKLKHRQHRDRVAPKNQNKTKMVGTFTKLGLSKEVVEAVKEMGISAPTEIQCAGIPAVLDGRSVLLTSPDGSGKTLAYMLPVVEMLRQDEASAGKVTELKRPRAVVLCSSRELSEQVFHLANAIGHHAGFRSTVLSGSGRLRTQADSLNMSVDMVVGTPGRVLRHIEEGNMDYGDIKYLVLDEIDTMFGQGFGTDIQKFLGLLKDRASKSDGQRYQTVLVTTKVSEAVQKLVEEEFNGIAHLSISSVPQNASAQHNFIKISNSENKWEALVQVLERSLSKGERAMIFCNTLSSTHDVDQILYLSSINAVHYHSGVPAEQRIENLRKFESKDEECSTMICTNLASRKPNLHVDHVIMFDFPLNTIDYMHRIGRTAHKGPKGKVTNLVLKKDQALATQIEQAIKKNQNLESLTVDNVQTSNSNAQHSNQEAKSASSIKFANQERKTEATLEPLSRHLHENLQWLKGICCSS